MKYESQSMQKYWWNAASVIALEPLDEFPSLLDAYFSHESSHCIIDLTIRTQTTRSELKLNSVTLACKKVLTRLNGKSTISPAWLADLGHTNCKQEIHRKSDKGMHRWKVSSWLINPPLGPLHELLRNVTISGCWWLWCEFPWISVRHQHRSDGESLSRRFVLYYSSHHKKKNDTIQNNAIPQVYHSL
jgi:hypothetical protein